MAVAVLLLLCALAVHSQGAWLGGVGKVDCRLPVGVPLAGFNHGARRYPPPPLAGASSLTPLARAPDFPLPRGTRYTTWMTPSVGWSPEGMWCRALTLRDTAANTSVTFLTIDGIGSDGTLRRNAVRFAKGSGFNVPVQNVIMSASHSHSGPGAIAGSFLWEVAPATDLLVPELAEAYTDLMAQALVQSQQSLRPVRLDTGTFSLSGVTVNRRCRESPYVNCTTIDPNLGLLRVDDAATSQPMALLWNFAIHGVCFGPSNLLQSGDIMGMTNAYVESHSGNADMVVLFQNADAGDIDPNRTVLCSGANAAQWAGPKVLGDFILRSASSLKPSALGSLMVNSLDVPFGPLILNATLARFNNCSSGGPLDICTLCRVLDCTVNGHLESAWVENTPTFTAVRISHPDGRTTGFVTCPGEALVELGSQVRADMAALGFTETFFSGYSNNHMGYFATSNEYDVGGYESQVSKGERRSEWVVFFTFRS